MRRGPVAAVSAAIVGVVVALLIIVLATRDPATETLTRSPLLDKPAPPIEAKTIDGKPFDLGRYEGEWVLVNFFATWCTPCRQEHPELLQLADADVTNVVSVVFQDDPDTVKEFLRKHGGDWPVVTDPTGEVTLAYGVPQIPESYLVAPNGIVVAKFIGVDAGTVTKVIRRFQ